MKNKIIYILTIFLIFIWINNTSLTVNKKNRKPTLLAHRGIAQTFDLEGVKWNTNTAKIIHTPDHSYIENTIPSMQKAFEYGADIVEFDIRITKDKKLAVFHDYTLDFRTDGKGDVKDNILANLKKLDIGYGYTSDNGKTFPFRGKYVGMMPSIDEVFQKFPDKKLLIHMKDGGKEVGILLDKYFQKMNPDQLDNISIYGNKDAILYLNTKYPKMKSLTKSLIIKPLILYELLGWTGYIPKSMRNKEIHFPIKYAKFLWGWPYRFLQRMENVNSRFALVNGKGKFSSGFNNEEELKKIPKYYFGCIWTDRIDKIAPCLQNR